jgi:Arm DNA-binding domain
VYHNYAKNRRPLTDIRIKSLKPEEARYFVADDNRLVLEVMTSGSKIWRYRYFLGRFFARS